MGTNLKYGFEYLNENNNYRNVDDLTKKELINKKREYRKKGLKIKKVFKYQTSRGSSKSPYREQWGRKQYY